MCPNLQQELTHFNSFRELYLGAAINCEQPQPPAPDITFSYENKNIGLEMTTLQVDANPGESSSQNEQERNYYRISEELESRLQEKIDKNFQVVIHFNFEVFLKRDRADRIINILETFLIAQIKNNNEELHIQSYKINEKLYEIIHLSVYFEEEEQQRVNISIASFCTALTNSKLNSVIKNKAERHTVNVENYNELWLLLIIEDGMLSSDFVDDDNYFKIKDTDVWAKIFLLKLRNSILIELK